MEDLKIEHDILAREAINARLPDSAKDQIIGSLHRVIKQRNSHSGHRIKTNSGHLEIMDSETHRLISLANHLTDPYVARELPDGIY